MNKLGVWKCGSADKGNKILGKQHVTTLCFLLLQVKISLCRNTGMNETILICIKALMTAYCTCSYTHMQVSFNLDRVSVSYIKRF